MAAGTCFAKSLPQNEARKPPATSHLGIVLHGAGDSLRRLMRFPPAVLFAVLALVCATGAHAQFVVPTGYTYNAGPSSYYPDDTGMDLSNGTTGIPFSNPFNAEQLAAWTGWDNSNPSINFQFATPQVFSRVEIGTTRWDAAGVGPLSSAAVEGFNFVSGVALANGDRDWVVLDGAFATTTVGGVPTLMISMVRTAQWTMLDEVRFTAIPEPAQTAAVLGALMLGVALIVRRR